MSLYRYVLSWTSLPKIYDNYFNWLDLSWETLSTAEYYNKLISEIYS